MSPFAALFEPFRLGELQLPNRIVMAPMTRQKSPDRTPGADVTEYYAKRARGGTGLIITEGTTLSDPASSGSNAIPALAGEPSLDGWRRVVDAVHGAGGRIFPQIWHVGVLRKPEESGRPDVPTVSPSGLLLPGKTRGEAMTEARIAETIEAFAEAAANAKAVGFDGIELHGAHGYLIDQFFWEGTNRRDDGWGGDMVGRTRFACDIVRACRRAVGPAFPIVLRFSQWKQQDYDVKLAPTPEALDAFLAPLTEAGVDVYHCSTRRYWEPEFEGSDLNLAGWTKRLSGKPTITVGSIGLDQDFVSTYASADTIGTRGIQDLVARLERGEFDLAAVGRALVANADWANQVRAGALEGLSTYDRGMLAELV
ncbi:MAG: NADH:flavin oxidoreductase [Pseudomonadales bacterium]|jgi:2,4-dienoyl-CoA reductase-like NADH-dependent reductase (Old Yellow Enzyme family)|nr:NADH:flavin oxidoreductase [Pseudomonadales bacterium]